MNISDCIEIHIQLHPRPSFQVDIKCINRLCSFLVGNTASLNT